MVKYIFLSAAFDVMRPISNDDLLYKKIEISLRIIFW